MMKMRNPLSYLSSQKADFIKNHRKMLRKIKTIFWSLIKCRVVRYFFSFLTLRRKIDINDECTDVVTLSSLGNIQIEIEGLHKII